MFLFLLLDSWLPWFRLGGGKGGMYGKGGDRRRARFRRKEGGGVGGSGGSGGGGGIPNQKEDEACQHAHHSNSLLLCYSTIKTHQDRQNSLLLTANLG